MCYNARITPNGEDSMSFDHFDADLTPEEMYDGMDAEDYADMILADMDHLDDFEDREPEFDDMWGDADALASAGYGMDEDYDHWSDPYENY